MPSPRDTALFLGMRNAIRLNVSNPTGRSVEGRARIVLARDWEQRVQSQLTWWGGIVNLVATNKGPVERIVFPTAYRKDATWIDGAVSGSTSITPGTMETIVLHVEAPADAAPVSYPAMLIFGDDTLRTSLLVQAPVKTHMFLPNGKATQLQAVFTNQTSERTTVSAEFSFDPAWKPSGRLQRRLTLDALGTTVVTIPLTLTGYSKDNQLYPVDARVDCGAYRQEVRHDFYVGTARFAPLPPSLNGSWNNWDRTNPMLITKASQIGRLLFGNQPWHGAEDLSAQLSVMYDDRYLYAGVAVSDDSLVTHWDFPRMSYPWDTDCMEVVLDTRTNSGQGQDPPMPGLYRHLCLAEYRETNFAAEAWQGAGAGGPLLPKPNLVPEAETYFHRTAHGYDMITRFPLSRLDSLVVKPGIKMGFDFAINDNDGTNYRKNQHIWAGYNQNQSWWDMGTIGALIFGPKTVR
jgi:hypothetical protein